mmetsp:Transcript_353/g.786  ORF Transcript_353/g.786 Transcript_353/m.786 type:complete len:145 (+) Transcript_353:329-763(+)
MPKPVDLHRDCIICWHAKMNRLPRGPPVDYSNLVVGLRWHLDFWFANSPQSTSSARVKSLKGVNATVVAINRKTMSKSIVMVNESNDFIDGGYPDPPVECMWHTQGVMAPFQWEGREYDQEIDDDEMVFTDFIFLDDGWSLCIR